MLVVITEDPGSTLQPVFTRMSEVNSVGCKDNYCCKSRPVIEGISLFLGHSYCVSSPVKLRWRSNHQRRGREEDHQRRRSWRRSCQGERTLTVPVQQHSDAPILSKYMTDQIRSVKACVDPFSSFKSMVMLERWLTWLVCVFQRGRP